MTDVTGTRSFAYDSSSLQLDIETLDAAFYDGLELTRSYDSLGRASGYSFGGTLSPVSATYGYNSTGRLQTVSDGTDNFTYDKIGNRIGSVGVSPNAYTANELNQYTAIDSTNPVHDLDGNLTSDGGNWTYTWNNENRLASATDGATTIDFTYDYQGRLVKKDDGTNVEVYVYDGWNRIATFTEDPSSVLIHSSSNLWGLDLSGSIQGAGGVGGMLKEGSLYPTYDANGNIMQKLDGTGAAVMSVGYDPFGNIIAGTLTGEYGFSTKPLIDGILMYYYGFRYYDPVTGRWPSRDPIEEEGGLNAYVMVANNALNSYDLFGLRGGTKCGGKTYNTAQEGCCGGCHIYKLPKAGTRGECCDGGVVGMNKFSWELDKKSSASDCVFDCMVEAYGISVLKSLAVGVAGAGKKLTNKAFKIILKNAIKGAVGGSGVGLVIFGGIDLTVCNKGCIKLYCFTS